MAPKGGEASGGRSSSGPEDGRGGGGWEAGVARPEQRRTEEENTSTASIFPSADPAAGDFDTAPKQYWNSPLVDPSRETSVAEEESRWPGHCYKSPWPLSETRFIASYSFDPLVGEAGPNVPNMFGLYLCDAFGNKDEACQNIGQQVIQ